MAVTAHVRSRFVQFAVIALIFGGVQLAVLAVGYMALSVLDTARAYAVGESYYSNGQKGAVTALVRYISTGDEQFFTAFRTSLAMPQGDHEARIALEKNPPDLKAARAGFLKGGSVPDDIPGVINMFLWAKSWGPFTRAVDDWREADTLTVKLLVYGGELHKARQQGALTEAMSQTYLRDIDAVDRDLVRLEKSFLGHLGEATRAAKNIVALILGICSLLLWGAGVAFTWRIFRHSMQADRRLADSEQRFRLFARIASDWFWETDRSGRVRYLSESMLSSLTAPPEDIVGRMGFDLLTPLATGRERKRQLADLAACKPFRGLDCRALGGNGQEMFFRLNGEPIFDEAGNFAGYRGTGTNITDEVVNRINLARAKEQAEAASRAKSQFLATMSHEIRTPINGVLGMAELLASTSLNERQQRLVENVTRSGQALLGIISNVLDFAKIEAGKFDLAAVPFDIRELAAELADMFAERCTRKGLEFLYYVAEDVPRSLTGDPVRLRQILVNLIGNAVKFTERGEIYVEISVARFTERTATLSFLVRDSGIGIPPDEIGRIFESFHQVDGSLTRARGGTGLGLSISRQLVEMMGGQITVESRPGQGSAFRFTAALERPGQDEPTAERHLPRPLKVLLAGTNPAGIDVIARYLAIWAVETSAVSSVEQAEKEMARQAFDVAILDAGGLEAELPRLAPLLRGTGRTELILLDSIDRYVAGDRLAELGTAAVLPKPVRASELFNALVDIASGGRSGPSLWQRARARPQADAVFPGTHLLVVEDNPINQEVTAGILESLGCTVTAAANGRAALEQAACRQFDLMLMDCEMPIVSGIEATRLLRAREQAENRPRVPVIAVTAHALNDVHAQCLEAGMDDFLVKPFTRQEMTAMLRRWLKPENAARQAEGERTASRPSTGTDVLDMTVIAALRALKSGKDGMSRLDRAVALFAEKAPSLAASILAGYNQGDGQEIAQAAHSLKSSAGVLGARGLSGICAEIEKTARSGDLEPVASLIPALDASLAATLAALTGLQSAVPGRGGEYAAN